MSLLETATGRIFAALLPEATIRAALADVDTHEIGRLVLAPRLELRVAAPGIVALAALDLDDVRAEIGKQPCAVGTGQHPAQVDGQLRPAVTGVDGLPARP